MKTIERCKSSQLDQILLTVHMTKWHKENEIARKSAQAMKDLKTAIICSIGAFIMATLAIGFYAGTMVTNHSVVEHHKMAMNSRIMATPEPTILPTVTPTPEPTAEPTPEPEPNEVLPVGFKYLEIPLSQDLQLHAATLCEENSNIWYSLMLAIMHVETGGTFDNSLVSSMGALGIMQVMPDNIKAFCNETGYTYDQVVSDPKINMMAGLRVWNHCIWDYSPTNTAGVLMRYNAGPGNAADMISTGIVSSYASSVLGYEIMYAQMLSN